MKQIDYKEARKLMLPGDVIAFGGKGLISAVIKNVTNCNVSHVGVILQTKVPTTEGHFINQIIESTSLGDGFAGVQINRMSIRIKKYNGDIWWLPLSLDTRAKFDQGLFFSFLLEQVGKEYDIPQAIGSALDYIPDNREDFDKLFCSELVHAGLVVGGVIEDGNSSEQTPADNCRMQIYREVCQLVGKPKELF